MASNLGTRTGHRATIAERVAVLLRESILSGTLKSGSPLREEELARQFDVSRHVVREVLRLLAADGVADYSSFRGSRVVHLTAADVHNIYEARRFLEVNTVRSPEAAIDASALARIHQEFSQAVERKAWREAFDLDLAFHAAIVDANKNALISEWHRGLVQRLRLAHLIEPSFQEEGLSRSVSQHAQVALAVAAGDRERIAHALESHLIQAEQQLSNRLD
jgi:DNA-binding GntR family transcriptional regulator